MIKKTLLVASSLLLLASCNNTLPEEYQEATGGDKVITLSLGGEFVSTSEKPLTPMAYTRAAVNTATPGKTLYAVNVLTKAGTPYAYGLFDDPSKMRLYISQQNTSPYTFEVTTVTEHADLLHQEAGSYAEPFILSDGSNLTPVTNRFIFSSTLNFKGLKSGEAMVKGQSVATQYPRMDRFYASHDWEGNKGGPAKTINIFLKRAVFGVKLNIIPPQRGEATVKLLGRTITVNSTDAVNYVEDYIYTFTDVHAAATATEATSPYEVSVPLDIKWTTPTNSQGTTKTQQISAKRNVKTVINIDFSSASDHGIQLQMEDKPMTEEKQDITVTE